MISKNKIKYIRSLEQKKNRDRERVFIAEGHKLVGDILDSFTCVYIAATEKWLTRHKEKLAELENIEIDEVTDDELRRISSQDAPQQVLAVFRQSNSPVRMSDVSTDNLCLALDDVQNPGNLGTIIRIANWFGIEHIFCSRGCADVYNSKTIQATMGGIAHVSVHYVNLAEELSALPHSTPVYGTFLDGDNIYTRPLANNGVIIMGNEGKGVSPTIGAFANERLYIPSYPSNRITTESLNVAIATAIVCAEFRRR